MLCSIATLIHDSYLPLYVHEELGLSTTKARGEGEGKGGGGGDGGGGEVVDSSPN